MRWRARVSDSCLILFWGGGEAVYSPSALFSVFVRGFVVCEMVEVLLRRGSHGRLFGGSARG